MFSFKVGQFWNCDGYHVALSCWTWTWKPNIMPYIKGLSNYYNKEIFSQIAVFGVGRILRFQRMILTYLPFYFKTVVLYQAYTSGMGYSFIVLAF